MVSIGVIGLGSIWEDRYRPAVGHLGHRLRVRAVFDPVVSRAEITATQQRADAESGLLSLARRPDIDALLLLETGWYGCEALRLLCSAAKPIYIAADLGDEPAMLQALHWTAMNFGLTLMPELGYRYTPASHRLRELMATRLGSPTRIKVVVNHAFHPLAASGDDERNVQSEQIVRRSLLHWFDWTRYVIRTSPTQVQVDAPAEESHGNEPRTSRLIRIDFASPRMRTTNPVAEFHCVSNGRDSAETGSAGGLESGHPEITCETGTAVIESPTVIRWKSDTNGVTEFVTESLTSDRSETVVMLDHFIRRVVGGLIPVADLADVSRSLELLHATRESWRSGEPVQLNAPPEM